MPAYIYRCTSGHPRAKRTGRIALGMPGSLAGRTPAHLFRQISAQTLTHLYGLILAWVCTLCERPVRELLNGERKSCEYGCTNVEFWPETTIFIELGW